MGRWRRRWALVACLYMLRPAWPCSLTLCLVLTWSSWTAAGSRVEADIYVYRDPKSGVMHYTNVPVRPRYRSVTRSATRPSPYRRKEEIYNSMIRELSRRYGVEFALVKAVIKAESGFNPRALSPRGARGLMQLMPQTATFHGVNNGYSPRENIQGGYSIYACSLSTFVGT